MRLSTADGETGGEAEGRNRRTDIPRSCSVGAMRMLRLERTGEKLMWMVALCADVEEVELEQVAVVEEVVRRVAMVDGEL